MNEPTSLQWACIFNAMRRNPTPRGNRPEAVKKARDVIIADIVNHRPDIANQWDLERSIHWDGWQFQANLQERSAIEQLGDIVEPQQLGDIAEPQQQLQ